MFHTKIAKFKFIIDQIISKSQSGFRSNEQYLIRLSCYIHRNPLRAKIIKGLADYKWGSYRTFAYADLGPDWLSMDLILSQVRGKDRHAAYRKKVQGYEKKMPETLPGKSVSQGGDQTFRIFKKGKYIQNMPDHHIGGHQCRQRHPLLPEHRNAQPGMFKHQGIVNTVAHSHGGIRANMIKHIQFFSILVLV